MNVLFVTSAFPSSDYPKRNAHNFRSILNLSRRIQNIQVVHLRSWRPWRKVWKIYQYEGINIWSYSFPIYYFLPSFIIGLNLIIYKKVLYHLFLKKQIQKFDLIHTAGVSMESIVGAYLVKKSGKKHIAQCMGSDVNSVLPLVSGYYGWKGFSSYVDLFTCNSKALQNSLYLLYPKVNALTIYRGINLDEFAYKPLNRVNFILNKTITFLYLGGIITANSNERYNSKGGASLLRAWEKVYNENNAEGTSIRLVFGGPNVDDKIVKSIISINSDLLNIDIVGEISIKEVKNYMDKASVIIIPSLGEGLPNVAMEAAATGRAVIGSNTGGIPEIVLHNVTGLLFQPGNDEELSKCINSYINDPAKVVSHGNNARIHVEKYFDSSKFVEKYLEIYNSLSS